MKVHGNDKSTMRRMVPPCSLSLLLIVAILPNAASGAISYGSCNVTSSKFFCPSTCDGEGSYVKDCFDCEGYMSSDTSHNICIDRRLFQPHNDDPNEHDDHYHYLWNDLVGALVWFITAGISIACGVGGGGIYVPIGILLFQWAPKQASGFSQASIFGAGLAGLILNSRQKHPVTTIRHDAGVLGGGDGGDGETNNKRHLPIQQSLTKSQQDDYVAQGGALYTRPVIDYSMALFMSPMQMAGAVLGVMVQKVLPNWLYLLFAGVVLSYTSYRTYKKYFQTRQKEKEQKQKEAKQEAATNTTMENVDVVKANAASASGTDVAPTNDADLETEDMQTREISSNDSASLLEGTDNDQENSGQMDTVPMEQDAEKGDNIKAKLPDQEDPDLELRKQFLEQDMRQYPMEKIGGLLLLWIGLFILTLLKGGKGVESLLGIQCDSPWYYVVIACQFLWLFFFAAFFGRKLLKDQEARVAVNYPYLGAEDPLWDLPSIRFYGGFCFISGVVAALIGIGGGMVLGPMMLIMGIDPRVSTATNSTMFVVTSSSIAIMFVTSGLVPWDYALFYFMVTFMGAWIGKTRIDNYVKKTGKASMLVFILASIIAFATIGCFVILFTRLAEKDWCLEDFNSFCSVDNDGGESCPVDNMVSSILTTTVPGGRSAASGMSASPPSDWDY